jgi:hypothetical protein
LQLPVAQMTLNLLISQHYLKTMLSCAIIY